MNEAATTADLHSVDSSVREQLVEHLFVGELLRCLWMKGYRSVEVLRPEVDHAGYDIVIEANGYTRHIQLKSSKLNAKTSRVDIHTALVEKRSGCVIWLRFNEDTLALGPYLWFGSEPGQALPPLGEKVAKHKRGDSSGVKKVRPRQRQLNKGRFETIGDIEELAASLFGI